MFFSWYVEVDAVDCNSEPKNTEGRLRKKLFCGYDKANRPILNDGPIMIKMKMIIKGFDFDDFGGRLTVSTWLAMVRDLHFSPALCPEWRGADFDFVNDSNWISNSQSWTDEHLKWEARDYNNRTSLTESSESIWSPDLALYNRYFCRKPTKLFFIS